MKYLIILALGLLTLRAKAQVATETETLTTCSAQYYDSDKRSCLNIIKGNNFDIQALNFCSKQYYDSDKRSCFKIITNKQFSTSILQFCKQQYYDSDKRSCLKSAESYPIQVDIPRTNYYPNTQITVTLKLALRALENKDYGIAEDLIRRAYIQSDQ